MTSVAYVCPKGERSHKPGTCAKHKLTLEKRCAHCDNVLDKCVCN